METLGSRLRRAIQEGPRGLSIRAFQGEMEERLRDTGVRGFTYPSINSYLNDETSPSLEFLEHAAEVLWVRLAYLAAGEGPMTGGEIDQDVAAVLHAMGLPADSGPHPWAQPVAEVVRKIGGGTRWSEAMGFDAHSTTTPVSERPSSLEGRDLLAEIGRALAGPLNALHVDGERMTYDALSSYILAMVPALMALAPEVRRQMELERRSNQEED